tara:strand:+ start:486 stop:968 length:483 start_codon:yes stop_codon:yes gene_type:complete
MATLTLGIKESVTIGGTTHSFDTTGSSDDFEITGVNHVLQQTLDILHTGSTQVVKFDNTGSPSEAAGQIKGTDFKYMRITNNDSSNFITVSLQDATNNFVHNYKLLAGQSMYFTSLSFDAIDASVTLGTQKITTLNATADEVMMRADTNTCSVSIFVAYA